MTPPEITRMAKQVPRMSANRKPSWPLKASSPCPAVPGSAYLGRAQPVICNEGPDGVSNLVRSKRADLTAASPCRWEEGVFGSFMPARLCCDWSLAPTTQRPERSPVYPRTGLSDQSRR